MIEGPGDYGSGIFTAKVVDAAESEGGQEILQ